MTRLYGGERARATRSSIFFHVQAKLNTLGWFTPGQAFIPVTMKNSDPEFNAGDTVALNTLALRDVESTSVDFELGQDFGIETLTYQFDLYAENDSVGLALYKDIQKILEGRMPNIGAGAPVIPLFNYSLATPAQFGYLDVDSVKSERSKGPNPWEKYWYKVRFSLTDYDV